MSSSRWNYQEYSGSRGTTLVTVTTWLSLGGEDVGRVIQGGCDGSLDMNQISRYYGLKMVVGCRISMGKWIGELGDLGENHHINNLGTMGE
jgi:hypothetical protein